MKKIGIFIYFLFLCTGLWGQITYSWVDDGNPGDWSDGQRWLNESTMNTDDGVPSTADIAIIDSGIVILDINAEIDELQIGSSASLVMDSSTLRVNIINNDGTINLDGDPGQLLPVGSHASISGTVVFNNNGTSLAGLTSFKNITIINGIRASSAITVSGDLIQNSGTLNAALEMTGNSNSIQAHEIIGTVTITGNITASGTVNIDGTLVINGTLFLSNVINLITDLFIDDGTLYLNNGSLNIDTLTIIGQVTISNGTLNVTQELITDASGELTGNVSIGGGNAVISFSDIIITNANGTICDIEAGGKNVSISTVTVSASIVINVISNSGLKNLTANNTGSLNCNSNDFDNVNINGDVILANYLNTDNFTNIGTLTLNGNNLNGNNLTFNNNNGILKCNGGEIIRNVNSINGTVILNGDFLTNGTQKIQEYFNLQMSNNANALTIAGFKVSGKLTIDNGCTLILGANTGVISALENAGTLVLSAHTLNVSGLFDQLNGSIQTNSGTIIAGSFIQAGGSITGNSLIMNAVTLISLRTINISGELNLKSTADIIINNGFEGTGNRLILEAAGNITITGDTGASAAYLGDITVKNGNVLFNDMIFAESYTQEFGSAQFEDAQYYTDIFSFTGTNLTLGTGAAITTVSGSVTINNSADFIQKNNAHINSAAFFTQTNTSGKSSISALINAANNINFSGPVELFTTVLTSNSNGINFAGIVELSGTIELNSGTGNGNITFTSANVPVIYGNGNLTLTADTGNVSFNGQIGSGINKIGNIIINNAAEITFLKEINSGDITATSADKLSFLQNVNAGEITTNSAEIVLGASNSITVFSAGDQNYEGNVKLSGNINLESGGSGKILFIGIIDGGANSLTIKNADVQFDEAVNNLTELKIEGYTPGNALIKADITTSGSQSYGGSVTIEGTGVRTLTSGSNQTFFGAVTLERELRLLRSGAAHKTVMFENTVDGQHPLTVTNADIEFKEDVGSKSQTDRLISLTVNTGKTTISKSIFTTGNQNYSGAVELNGINQILTSETGSININGILSNTAQLPNASLVVNASKGISINNSANSFSGVISLNNQTNTPVGDILFSTLNVVTVNGINEVTNGKYIINTFDILIGNAGIEASEVILTSLGSVSQASNSKIKTGVFRVNAASGIELEGSNEVGTLEITGAGNDIRFKNNIPLLITGISNVNHDISINNSGSVTLTGNIGANNNRAGTFYLTAVGGSVTVNGNIWASTVNTKEVIIESSANENITINGQINCYRLSLLANGTGKVEITNTINVTSNETEGENSAVFISANILEGTGTITLGAGGEVCAYISNTSVYTGNVINGFIHYHAIGSRHIVYSPNDSGHGLTAGGYIYINSDIIRGRTLNAGVNANIYIIDVGNIGTYVNKFNCIDSNAVPGSGSGFIEIRKNYTADSVDFNAGSAGIYLYDAVIALTNDFNTKNKMLTLRDGINNESSVTTDGNIIIGNRIEGAGNNIILDAGLIINITGAVGTNSARIGDITVDKGNITFNDNVNAKSYKQITGNANFNALHNYTNSFLFNGDILTLGENSSINTNSGDIIIINTGIFTQESGASIVSGGVFTQNGIGSNRLSASISAKGNISFTGTVSINENITLDSNAANNGGNIGFSHNGVVPAISGSKNLTMNAGAGDITIAGQIGTNSLFFADILINSASKIDFNEAVYCGDIIVSTANEINFLKNVNADKININAVNITVDGLNPITISSKEDQKYEGNVTIGGTSGNVEFSVLNSNSLNAVIRYSGNVSLLSNAQINLPSTGGTLELVQINETANTLTINGGNAGSPFIIKGITSLLSNVNLNCNIIISNGSDIKINNNVVINQTNGKTLALEEDSVLEISNTSSWYMGTAGTGSSYEFAGINGTLKLGTGSKLITNDLRLEGVSPNNFILNNNGKATISVMRNAEIAETVDFTGDLPELILEMAGSTQEIIANQKIGSFHIKKGSHTTLKSNLEIGGEVQIDYAYTAPHGILRAENFNISLYAQLNESGKKVSRWKIINAPETISGNPVSSYNMNAFVQNTGGLVELKKESPADDNVVFEILGNTVWQSFKYDELGDIGAVIQFSMHPDQHIFLHSFIISGKEDLTNKNGYVTLTRYTGTSDWTSVYPSTVPPNVPPGAQSGIGIEDNSLPRINPIPRNLKTDNQENKKFWNFNLVSHGGNSNHRAMNISFVKIFFSHAWNQRIPIAVDTMHLDAIPYFAEREGNIVGFFNYDWVEVRKIIYSFIEDSNGNGRADRIRVQTNVALNGDFSKFTVEVEGYKIDLSRPTFNPVSGFDVVEALTNETSDGLSFYIYLEEKTELYDGKPIMWWVTRNESLKDIVTQTLLVGDPITGDVIKDEFFTTTNTIPPRISYAITLPGHNQTYIKLSQPVAVYGDTLIIDGNNFKSFSEIEKTNPFLFALEYYPFDQEAEQYFIKIPEGTLSYLLELKSSPNVEILAKLPAIGELPLEYFSLEGLNDLGVRALDWFDERIDSEMFMYYPSPRYPVNWNYTQYKTYTGNSHLTGYNVTEDDDVNNPTDVFLPPNKLLTPEMVKRLNDYYITGNIDKVILSCFDGGCSHALCANADNKKRRSTDILVSMPPVNNNSSDYFVWPIWARFADPLNSDTFTSHNDFWGQLNTDTGIIWRFDGTKYLEARGDVELQARINSAITGKPNLEISWSVNVPETLRYPQEPSVRGRSQGGLWLPGNKLLYNFTPSHNKNNINQSTDTSSNFPLYNFMFNTVNSGNKVEFIFRFTDSDMFIARLDVIQEQYFEQALIPNNWYQLIRPFSFDVQDIRLQRGGVTILNNVINSNDKEVTYIRYHLVRPGRVTIQVYTLDGTLVKSLRRNEYRAAGEYTDAWDGTNNGGRSVARGMYFVRVVAPDIDEIRKIMVVK